MYMDIHNIYIDFDIDFLWFSDGCLKSNLIGISLNLQDLGCRLQGAVMRCSIFLAVQICSDFLLNRDNVR
jgi:hypothetical protein